MKKIICFLTMFLLFFTLTSCNDSLEAMGGETMTFYVGQTGQFEDGYVYYTNDKDVLEISGNSYTALKEGSAVVTVKKDDNKIGVYLIAIYGDKPIVLNSLDIKNCPETLTVATPVKLEYKKNPIDANDYDALVWTSSNSDIATVDKEGNVTPLKMGEVTITLAVSNKDIKKEVTFTVLPRETIFKTNYSRIVGVSGTSEEVLKEEILTDYSFDGNITWFSEDETVVKVDQTGKTTFVQPGTTNVGIKGVIDNKDVTYKCSVTVLNDTGYKLIRTPEQLQEIENISGNYMLGNDIDMTEAVSEAGSLYNDGKGFMPLFDSAKNSFKGVFDGNGFSIKNMYINRPNDTFVAFMRYISAEEGNEGIIKRLSFVGGEINGGNYTSVFYANSSGYGSVDSGLRDCYVEMKVSSVGSLSALVGNNKGLVENCIVKVEYDALAKVSLFALNQITEIAGVGVNNCVFIGDYEGKEMANITNGGFVENCHTISVNDISQFEFNMGSNWTWVLGNLPVLKGVA